MKKKFKLDEIQVESFVTSSDGKHGVTRDIRGGFTGNCGSPIGITCPGDCDFPSIPIDECVPTAEWCTYFSECVCGTEIFTRCTCPE